MSKAYNFFLIFFLGIIISIPVLLPYFNSNYFPTHDGEWAVVRAAEMFREIRDLQLPPRFSQALNFGYGYPLFNFAYPGPYYITTFIHALGFSFIASVKILFVVTVPLSFYGMYLFSSSVFKKKISGIISAVLYIFIPYRLVDLFVRGNIGESISFALFPLICWCFYNIVTKKRKMPFVLFGSILLFILIISHNIMSVYFGIIFITFFAACFVSRKIKEGLIILGTFIWGLLLSAYFVIPALFEKQYIKLSIIPIADRNLYYTTVEKLLFSKWGYGTPTESNPFPYLIGLPQLFGVPSVLYFRAKKNSFEKTLIIFFSFLLLLFIFMMFPASSLLWKLPLLNDINYPWTLLLPIGFLACFLTGAVTLIKKGVWIGIFLAVLSIFLYFPYAKPLEYFNRGDIYYITNEATTTSSQELMPLWVSELPTGRYIEKVEATGDNYATNIYYDSKKISFIAEMKSPGTVTVTTIYYPGWKAYANNLHIPISYDNSKGLIKLNLLQGTYNVVLHFTETPLRIGSDIISFSAILVFLGVLFAYVALSIQEVQNKSKITSEKS